MKMSAMPYLILNVLGSTTPTEILETIVKMVPVLVTPILVGSSRTVEGFQNKPMNGSGCLRAVADSETYCEISNRPRWVWTHDAPTNVIQRSHPPQIGDLVQALVPDHRQPALFGHAAAASFATGLRPIFSSMME